MPVGLRYATVHLKFCGPVRSEVDRFVVCRIQYSSINRVQAVRACTGRGM